MWDAVQQMVHSAAQQSSSTTQRLARGRHTETEIPTHQNLTDLQNPESAGGASSTSAPWSSALRLPLYLQAMRVKSLGISSVCVLAGGAVAIWQGHFQPVGLFFAWLGAVSVQAGTNLTNVCYNYKSTASRAPGALFDPQGSAAPVRLGILAPSSVRAASLFCFALGMVAGVALTGMYGWRILAMGIPGLLAGYFYAAPPVRLAYLGLGVVTVSSSQ
jgi:1,4-dihydroxy-2-naphthoate octaprenyltransferase